MPVPKPRKQEKKEDFISRCMGDETMNKEYPDQKVRSGICYTQWQQKELTLWTEGLQLTNNNAEPKDEIMLFPYGEFEHPVYGKLNFDNEFFNEIIINYQNNVLHVKPFMDKQHDEDKALAWFDTSPYVRPGLGLFIKPDYTELGSSVLKTRTYRYFSPSWGKYKDPQSGKEFANVLMGGAATNIPFLKTMPPIIDEKAVLDNKGMAKINLTDLTIIGNSGDVSQEKTPSIVNKKQGDKMEKLIQTFGLNADATEDTILTKIDELRNENESLKKEVGEIKDKIESEKAKASELDETKQQLSDLQIKLLTKDRDDVIKKALSAGKIRPKDKEYWEKRFMSDPENVTKDLDKFPVIVDFSESGTTGEGKAVNDDPGQQIVDEAKKLMNEKKARNFDEAIGILMANNPKLGQDYMNKYKA